MSEVRLIDANALLNDLKASAKSAREWREETQDEEIKIRAEQAVATFIECALRVISAPTIEPERKKGHIIMCNGFGCCSECGKRIGIGCSNYCRYCGAELEVT